MPRGGKRVPAGGRPVTVGGTEQVHVRVSSEMHERVRAAADAAHVSMSEAVRLVLELVVDSPGDMLAAMVADPEAVRTEFVERASSAVAARAVVR